MNLLMPKIINILYFIKYFYFPNKNLKQLTLINFFKFLFKLTLKYLNYINK